MILFTLLAACLSLLAYLIFKTKQIYKTWSDRGVPHEEPTLFFGNSLRTLLLKTTQGERMKEVCDAYPEEPLVGYYDFLKPMIIIKDPSWAEIVLIKEFPHFLNHGFEVDESVNPLDMSLFNMTGKKWRAVRNKLSPIFTTGKLKTMYEQMHEIGNSMEKIISSENLEGVELRDILSRFAMDVIGSFAFGIDAGALANPNSKFIEMGKKAEEFDMVQVFKFMLLTNCPSLCKMLGISFNKKDVQDYFVKIIQDTLSHRRSTKTRRNDFIDLMLQLSEKGSVEITTKDPNDAYLGIDNSYKTDSFKLTDDLIMGNAFVFLTSGFEGTAILMTLACYELSKNLEIQDKARKEVSARVKQHGNLGFDAVKEMDYLEMCLKETLRKYPPAQTLFRVCTKEYTFPSGVTVQPGDSIMISVFSIHRNPLYYPDPMKFDPERFHPDASQRPCTFIPFGEGPRICIAMRFAMLQIKYGLAKILIHYKLKPSPKTKEPLVLDPKMFITSPKDPIYFDLEKI